MGAIGLNLLTGIYRPLVTPERALSWGQVGLCLLASSETIFPEVNILVWIIASEARVGAGRRPLRFAQSAHQGLLSGGGDAGGAVLSPMVLRACALARQSITILGRDRGADPDLCSACPCGPARPRRRRYAICVIIADDRRRPWPGLPPTSCTGGLDACGWRCATWTLRRSSSLHPPVARQVAQLFAVSSFYVGASCRCHDGGSSGSGAAEPEAFNH